jgi:hypothetical protein
MIEMNGEPASNLKVWKKSAGKFSFPSVLKVLNKGAADISRSTFKLF